MLVWNDGDRYEGQFVEGMIDGVGTYIRAGHRPFHGRFKRGFESIKLNVNRYVNGQFLTLVIILDLTIKKILALILLRIPILTL